MSALPFILGVIFGATIMAFIAGMGDRRHKLIKDMRGRIRSLNAQLRIERTNSIRHLAQLQDARHRLELIDLDYREAA